MTDQTKRHLLKSLSAASIAAAIPAAVIPAAAMTRNGAPMSTEESTLSVSFSRNSASSTQVVTLTNHSKGPSSVSHISPGRVSSGGELFDVNDLFREGALTLSPGESRSLALSPAAAGATKRSAPVGTTTARMATLSTHVDTFLGPSKVHTQRLVIA